MINQAFTHINKNTSFSLIFMFTVMLTVAKIKSLNRKVIRQAHSNSCITKENVPEKDVPRPQINQLKPLV